MAENVRENTEIGRRLGAGDAVFMIPTHFYCLSLAKERWQEQHCFL
jgi:hypothetical protein